MIVGYAAVVLANPKGIQPATSSRSKIFYESLTEWDGDWYVTAAEKGYGQEGINPQTGESTQPFFPLLPALIKAGSLVGLNPRVAGLTAVNFAFIVGLFFCHRLFALKAGVRQATAACWITGAGPFSVVFSMIYPESLMLAATAAAFYFFEKRRPFAVALCAAIASLARPNGAVTAAVLSGCAIAVTVSSARPAREILRWTPVAVFPAAVLGSWMFLLWRWTGDPFAFVSAKRAWAEVTVESIIVEGQSAKVSLGTLSHVALAIAAFVLIAYAWRNLPLSWKALWFAYVIPALFFGLAGTGRYSWSIFPVFAAAGWASLRRRVAVPLTYAVAVSATLVTTGIFMSRLVP
ncbi:MAG: hypothetical protein C4319_06820 [Acidimicrobiia bacterium]